MAFRIRNLCVFCGSGFGTNPLYRSAAFEFGRLIGEQGMGLVYGGSGVGLMGELARSVLLSGGRVTGVIPEAIKMHVPHLEITELIVVSTMHERKAAMYELSDAFVALPGGIGTMDEFFEVFTWSQLGFHRKPVGLYNMAGYYDHLVRFLEHSVAEGFLKKSHGNSLVVDSDPCRLFERLKSFEPVNEGKWIDGIPVEGTTPV